MDRRDALRILDANLNRAREAARVVEDALRFGRPGVAGAAERARALRHRISGLPRAAGVSPADLLWARDSRGDPGREGSGPTGGDPLGRNLARLEEALRSAEEAARALRRPARPFAEARFAAYDLERFARLPAGRRGALEAARLYVILDPDVARRPLPEVARAAARAGVRLFQVRAKGRADRETLGVLRRVIAAVRPSGALVLANDRADLALAAGADGLHLGTGDLPVREARRILGADALVGGTAHSAREARAAERAGADYIGYGTVFATERKPERRPCGPGPVVAAARMAAVPVFAIGGIGPRNLAACLRAGVARVAICGAVCGAPDPGKAARGLLRLLGGDGPGKVRRRRGR